LIILVDTREQLPYWSRTECAKLKLFVGDYTTTALFNHTHIERKSAIDFWGTLTRGYRRFRNEIVRARDAQIRLVILVETTESKFYAMNFIGAHRLAGSGEARREQIKTLRKKYGLEIIWAKNRQTAKLKCHAILSKGT
jgi:ERCC4-type nuclease